jgi:hypothetical protein
MIAGKESSSESERKPYLKGGGAENETSSKTTDFYMGDMVASSGRLSSIYDSEFLSLFNGQLSVANSEETVRDSYEWLLSSGDKTMAARKILACLKFNEAPPIYVVTGYTKSTGKGEGKGVDVRLAAYLPMLSDQEMSDWDKDTKVRHAKARSSFPAEFKNLNLTRIKSIALGVIHHANDRVATIPLIRSFREKHGMPLDKLEALKKEKTLDQTEEIMKETLSRFQQQLIHHDKMKVGMSINSIFEE